MLSALKRLVDPLRPRLVPSFIIIGAQKAGTSALFKMLARHPQVLAPEVKELHFFDNDTNYAKGPAHYRAQFPLVPRGGGKVTFEATPAYLFAERAAERLHAHLPDARLVAILRDPVKRAYSAWNMFRDFANNPVHGHLHDARSFAQAVEDELSGREVPWEHRYLARGHYATQLRRYFDLFGRDRVLVVPYRDLRDDPQAVLQRVCAHTGLQPHAFDPQALRTKDNVRGYPEPLDPVLAERLYAYFAPHADALRALLGTDIDLNERRSA
jgi:hypothetical protein